MHSINLTKQSAVTALIAMFILTTLLAACGRPGTPSNSAHNSPTLAAKSGEPAKSAKPRDIRTSQDVCPARGRVLAGVYHPVRLTVIDPCKRVSGTIKEIRHEEDGDLHINVSVDPAYRGMLNEANKSKEHGYLVVEFMARDGGHLPEPNVGDHVDLLGAYVMDEQHGWHELHPVWSETLSGRTYTSGPQYGGSPARDRSANAEGDCRTAARAHCRGYGGAVSREGSDEGSESDQGSASNSKGKGGYYLSTSPSARTIYCADDPQWKSLSKRNLQHFDTLEEAKKKYPDYHLHKPC